jgi:hypothetical protein
MRGTYGTAHADWRTNVTAHERELDAAVLREVIGDAEATNT